MKAKGRLIVLSSPSGGGKTTISEKVLRTDAQLVRSISVTTRLPRGKEKNGRDYFFMETARFQQLVSQGCFLEWAKVHDHCYGTLREVVEKNQHQGKDVLLVIDVQGGLKVKKMDRQAVLIFVKPPSLKELDKRLQDRGTDNSQTIRRRLQNARWELSMAPAYDYIVENKVVKQAVEQVRAIITAERLRNLCVKKTGMQQGVKSH